jgi:hypothetical protein
MTMSETIGAIAPALVKAQAEIKPIVKDSTNPAFRSKYTSLDAIMEVVRPVMAKHGLFVVQSVLDTIDGEHSTSITVESRIIHSSGEWIAGVVQVPVMQQTSHGFGSALSYGRRYSLSALLSLASDEDDDGNGAIGQQPQQPRQQLKPGPPPQNTIRKLAPTPKPIPAYHNGSHYVIGEEDPNA